MEPHYNNPINTAGLHESERAARCCYSENPGRARQTGCVREGANGTITKLKEGADGKTGDAGTL